MIDILFNTICNNSYVIIRKLIIGERKLIIPVPTVRRVGVFAVVFTARSTLP